MQRELVEVQAIAFKRKKIKEADVFVKLLTKDNGIFTVDARGALRPKSKLGPATMNFSYGKYIVNTSFQGISSLRTYKSIKQFENIYLDITKNAYSSYILDLADHAFIEYQNLGEYFNLIYLALKKINEGYDYEIITQLVQLKLLKAYGVNPNFVQCVICGKNNGKFDFSIEHGGLICSDHFNVINQRMFLDEKTISLIRTLALINIAKLGKININSELKAKSRNIIDKLYMNYLDLNLKTKKFLDELNLLDY